MPQLSHALMENYRLIITSALITVITALATIKLAPKFKLMDYPDRKHPAVLHRHPIARGGGIPLFISFLITTILFVPLNYQILAILCGGFINVLAGTIDDRQNLHPLFRLLVSLPLSTIPVILSGLTISLSNPLTEGLLTFQWLSLELPVIHTMIHLPEALLISIWIIWMCNTINWSKGVSQLPGISTITFLTLAGVSLKYQAGNPLQNNTAQLSIILAFSCLAFLPFNFPPERIFPGFGGSTFIGFNIATLSLLSGGKLAAALLVLAVPAVDMILTFWRRIKQRRNPLIGDREHFYHLLLTLGLTKRQIILLYLLFTGILGFFALYLERSQKIFAIILTFILISGVFLTLNWLITRSKVHLNPSEQ